ncbi:hypothetical protein EJ02DRAFT_389143 [Clathrospora elynae]|uniref:Chromo domain-containing protein n=1 Tax=Clathrospora elynae TaxID=706981 RepID=A0A6A5SDG6_9PLEO|nr:hypothetical protein EJ02DRAFT_389143 [Clathrospora elynae]
MSPDPDYDWDTDEISVTSTDLDEGGEYNVDKILAEKWLHEWPDGYVGMKWLLRWEGYRMDECTWEPKHNLLQSEDALAEFYDKKKVLGEFRFQEYMAENEAEFEAAAAKAEAARIVRKAKRRRKRRKLRMLARQVEEGGSKQQKVPPAVALATREAEDSSQLNSLFINSSPDSTPASEPHGSGLLGRQPPKARKPPLYQSDQSSSDDGEISSGDGSATDDSMLEKKREEARQAARRAKRKTTGTKPLHDEQRPTRKSLQSPQSPGKRNAAIPKPNSTTKAGETKIQRSNETRRNLQPQAVTAAWDQRGEPSAQNSTASLGKNQPPIKPAVHTSTSTVRKGNNTTAAKSSVTTSSTLTTAATGGSNSTNRPIGSISGASAKRTVPITGGTGGIKIVNEPKNQLRSQWQNSDKPDKLYQTLQFRRIAEQRSRREGTPDIGALEIVNDPLGVVKPRPRVPIDDLYARRETGTRRFQEDDEDDIPGAILPLADWELDKVPLVCSDWRLSSNCQLGAQKCRFMHRNQDPQGRNYPVGDVAGRVPGKYRKPPITCPYWLNSPQGCTRADEVCLFAHRNTGWILHPNKGADQPSQIDPRRVPEKQRLMHNPLEPEISSEHPADLKPTDLTCWFWKEGKCQYTPSTCIFQHHHTGIIAGPLTCRFWASGDRCHRSAQECKFQHYHSCTIAGQQNGEPRSTLVQPAPGVSNSNPNYEPLGRVHAPIPTVAVDVEMNDAIQPYMADEVAWYPPQSPTEEPQRQHFQPTPPPPPPIPPTKLTCVEVKVKIEQAFKINFEDMFTRNNGEKFRSLVDRRAFLVYDPKQHSAQLDLLTRWLLMHHVQISSPRHNGSWEDFKEQIMTGGTGVIIAHPDFEYFTELPGLGQVLRKHVRLWSVGLQEGIEYDAALSNAPPEIRQDCIDIFPHGGFIYITDEVFETKPQLALKITKLFFAKIDKLRQLAGPISPWHEVDDASILWRLCVRPELMEYLFEHCANHEMELEAGDPDVQSRAELYKIFDDTNYIEQDDSSTPVSLVADKYPIISERREIAECQPVDYFNTLAHSQEKANLHMIRYFAGLQVDMRREYRHFFVVHTEPRAPYVQQWKQEIQTIAEVITPEQCVEEFQKAGEDSLFDFCERFMPEYTVKNWKELPLKKALGV